MNRYGNGNNIEVVVTDNASTDGTYEELLQIKDKRLRIYRHTKNYGAGYNAISGWHYANGKYILHINDRDNVAIEELPDIIDFLRDNDYDFIAVYCDSSKWYKYGKTSLVVLPSGEELANIEQRRDGEGRVYFEPKVRALQAKNWIINPYIKENRKITYISMVYKNRIWHLFYTYYFMIKYNMYELERYHYTAPKHVFWVKEGITFYSEIVYGKMDGGIKR